MIISASALDLLIIISTIIVAIAPISLMVFWFKDKKGGKLW